MEGRGDEIYLAHIDGSEARNLTKTPGNDGHPWFSRDGSFIVIRVLSFAGNGWVSAKPAAGGDGMWLNTSLATRIEPQ